MWVYNHLAYIESFFFFFWNFFFSFDGWLKVLFSLSLNRLKQCIMIESLNQHKLLIQLVAGKNLKMSSWISKMHLRSQMNYLSTQMQPKTNLIIFGILLSKFISHWIITNYIWTIYVPSFHCIRLMTFVRIDGVFFFFVGTQVWTHFVLH